MGYPKKKKKHKKKHQRLLRECRVRGRRAVVGRDWRRAQVIGDWTPAPTVVLCEQARTSCTGVGESLGVCDGDRARVRLHGRRLGAERESGWGSLARSEEGGRGENGGDGGRWLGWVLGRAGVGVGAVKAGWLAAKE
jgi:hypothetical protein